MLEGKKKYNSLMMKILLLLMLALVANATIHVAVSIAPERYFVAQIAGKDTPIMILVPTGASPATYAPKPSQLKALKDVNLYFTIGVPFEKNWLSRFQSVNPTMQIVDVTKGIQKRSMHEEDHDHDAHHHKGLDPHIWLSPPLVKIVAKNILLALTQANPNQKSLYTKNYEAFIQKIAKIDKQLKATLSPLKQKNFIVFHPSFGYFADAYGLTQIAIEREGKEPSLKYLKRVIDFAKKEQIKTIFVAPQFSQKSAKRIATQVGEKVLTIDPLAEDWEKNIVEIARSFETADRD